MKDDLALAVNTVKTYLGIIAFFVLPGINYVIILSADGSQLLMMLANMGEASIACLDKI